MSSPGALGFVGLGNLGHAMAEALLGAGRELIAYDIEGSRAGALVSRGARVAPGLATLSECPVVLLAVPDDTAVTTVVDELLEVLAQPSLFIVHSTVLPATPQRLQVRCTERGHDLLDAPVSGGAQRARKGDLAIMVGGTERSFSAARPILSELGSSLWHMGGPGAGAAAKLANQLMTFATLAGVQEALQLTDSLGVSRRQVLEMTSVSTSGSWVAEHWGFWEALATDYDTLDTPVSKRPWSKDLWDVLALGRSLGADLPVAALLSQLTAARVESAAAEWRERRQTAPGE